MFVETLVTIAKIWKQPKCSPVDDGQLRCGIYTMKYYLTVKKKERNHSICNKLDRPREYYAR